MAPDSTFPMLGVSLALIAKNELSKRIEQALIGKDNNRLFIVTANPEILLKAWHNEAYGTLLNSANIVVADGVGIVLVARFLYRVNIPRVTGVDLADDILALAVKHHKRVFLLGGSETANEKAIKKFKDKGLESRGLGGNFSETQAMGAIRAFEPGILFVALGAPKQEIFISNLLKTQNAKVNAIIAMGIGGTVDVWAGDKPRAPRLLRRLGLEWFWRLILEPRRLPRIINAIIVFPFIAVYEYIMAKRSQSKPPKEAQTPFKKPSI